MSVKASIITIGDELLIGQVIDTNSAVIAQLLNGIGISVSLRLAVGDDKVNILDALNTAESQSDIIIITGGLGPTADDITKPLLCEYFGGTLIENKEARENVISIFTKANRPVTERNLTQALVPDVCTMLLNVRGTAPGMLFRKNNKVYFSLPGVPHEMNGLMQSHVLPYLYDHYPLQVIAHRTMTTAGIPESSIADHIKSFEEALPHYIKLAYLPNYGLVRLRLTGTGNNISDINTRLDQQFSELQSLLKDHIVSNRDETMQETVARLLQQQNKTLGTAESCTGGYIAHLVTSMAGSSNYYLGSVVSYANSVKHDILNVSQESLDTVGAVSEPVVIDMANGILNRLKTDYAIATSGIMGPGGGTDTKPVGTVWVAVGNKNKIVTQCFKLRYERQKNIEVTAMYALNLLRKFMVENN